MQSFLGALHALCVPAGAVGVGFLGQAGFIFKTPGGALAAIDPYLSDCCYRYFGFKRLMPYLVSADELVLDYLFITHAHFDHFDPDSVPLLMANGRTELFGAPDTRAECARLNLHDRLNFLAVGDVAERGELRVTAVNCDHGEGTPDAIGLLLEAAGRRIYLMGDTALRPEWYADERLRGVDLLILPINGAFGNLNEREAAQAAAMLAPKLVIPSHYWNFAAHGGNPQVFAQAMQEIAPGVPYRLTRQGEVFLL